VAKLGFLAGAQLFTFSIQTVIVTFILIALYVLPRWWKEIKTLSPEILGWLILSGALSGGLGTILGNAGIQLTTATNAGFLFQCDIALTILFAWILLKERLDKEKIIMLFLIIIGTFFLTTKGQLILPHVGDMFILLTCVCFATNAVLTRKVLKHTSVHADIATFFRAFAGIPVLLLFILPSSFYPLNIRQIFAVNLFDFHQSIYIVGNSIFSVGTLFFLNRTLKIASASYTAMIAAVTPIIVAVLAMVFLKETLISMQLFGAFLIICASFVTHVMKVDKD